eukprot:CFRG3842T1
MPMFDICQFGDDEFDVKRWVNDSLVLDGKDEGVDQQAASLVLQLQNSYHELMQSLDNDCKQTIQNVPRALIDVETLRYDTLALWEKLDAAREDIEKVEETTGQSILTLSQVDSVKQRMATTTDSLTMAQKWTQLQLQLNAMGDTIESLSVAPGSSGFSTSVQNSTSMSEAQSDTHSTGNDVATPSSSSRRDTIVSTYRDGILEYHALVNELRTCLSCLKKVSDYAERSTVLETYEAKLEKAIHPRLVDALTTHSLSDTRTYRDLLESMSSERGGAVPAINVAEATSTSACAKGRGDMVRLVFVQAAAKSILNEWVPTSATASKLSPMPSPRPSNLSVTISPTPTRLDGSEVNSTVYVDDLSSLYSLLLSYLTTESQWIDAVFKESHLTQRVQCDVINRVLTDVKPSVSVALNEIASVGQVVKSPKLQRPASPAGNVVDILPELVGAHTVTQDFVDSVDALFIRHTGENTDVARKGLQRVMFSPFSPHQRKFGALVETHITKMVEKLLRFPQVGYLDTVRRVAESVPVLFTAIESGREACFQFTFGLGYKALCKAVDNVAEAYFYKMNVLLSSLRSKCNLDIGISTGPTANNNSGNPSVQSSATSSHSTAVSPRNTETDYLPYGQQDWSHFQGALMLLQACGDMIHRCHKFKTIIITQAVPFAVSVFEEEMEERNNHTHRTSARSPATDNQEESTNAHAVVSTEELDITAPYNYLAGNPAQLTAALADSKAILQQQSTSSANETGLSFSSATSTSVSLLTQTETLVSAFNDAVHTLAFDIIFVHVERMLAVVPSLPSWSQKPSKSGTGSGFSLMQQNYITHVGQHMLTLPQQLELFNECVDDSTANENLTAALIYGSLPSYYTSPVPEGTEKLQHLYGEDATEDSDDNIYAHKWLEAVAQATMKRYVDRILQIRHLTDNGCLQLAKDIEYLSNILNVLDVDMTLALSHIKTIMDASETRRLPLLEESSEYESIQNIDNLMHSILKK